MFFKKDKPVIKFTAREDLLDLIPHPVPATKAMPEWFRKLKPVIEGSSIADAGSVKRCVPVLDAVSQGFIIPLWADLHVQVKRNEEAGEDEVWMKFPDQNDMRIGDMIGGHGWQQVGNACDLKRFKMGKVLLKFTNPWVIETAPGWSVKFQNPANNWSNDITIVEGVVDTDTYYNEVNFPYVWSGSEYGEFIIPRGTPLIHVIPFKRTDVALEVGVTDEARKEKNVRLMGTKLFDKYRTFFWNKRKV